MIVTEAQAKKTWCPWRERAPARNDGQDGLAPSSCCLGSGCMQWRWAGFYQVNEAGAVFHADRAADDKTGSLKRVEVGYCGLGDKPLGAGSAGERIGRALGLLA